MSNDNHAVINMSELTSANETNNSRHQNNENHYYNNHSAHNGQNGMDHSPRSRSGSLTSIDRRHASPGSTRRHLGVLQERQPRDIESATNDAVPLLETESVPKHRPPIAHPEVDDDIPDNDGPYTPENHPGVDDGFFPHTSDEKPRFVPRAGEDDVPHHGIVPSNGGIPRRPSISSPFPYAPGFNPNILMDADGNSVIIPDVNVYQHKKTLAQGMMDLALLSANANQLRYVLESYNRHPYYYFSITFISMSLILQIAVGVGLIWNSRYNVKNEEHICKADKINNFTVLGIFLITVVNVFIASFGVADSPPNIQE